MFNTKKKTEAIEYESEYCYQVVQHYDPYGHYKQDDYNIFHTAYWGRPYSSQERAVHELERCSFPGSVLRLTVNKQQRGYTAGTMYQKDHTPGLTNLSYWESRAQSLPFLDTGWCKGRLWTIMPPNEWRIWLQGKPYHEHTRLLTVLDVWFPYVTGYVLYDGEPQLSVRRGMPVRSRDWTGIITDIAKRDGSGSVPFAPVVTLDAKDYWVTLNPAEKNGALTGGVMELPASFIEGIRSS